MPLLITLLSMAMAWYGLCKQLEGRCQNVNHTPLSVKWAPLASNIFRFSLK